MRAYGGPASKNDAYSAIAQIIATLFVAVVLEFFVPQRPMTSATDRTVSLCLIGFSWTGLFACVRAMVGRGEFFTAALAVGGLTAVSVLASLAIFARYQQTRSGAFLLVALIFLFPPMLVLVVW